MKGGSHTSRILAAWHKGKLQHKYAAFKDSRGFTIVEVLVVLAVTGALFISAATIISGRTNRTQFEQSINEVTAQIRLTINEVSTGFYPNASNFRCERNGAGIRITSGNAQQGTNADCIFLGKVMQFGVADTDPQQYTIFSVAGLRTDTQGNEITNLNTARVIAPTGTTPNVPDASDTKNLQYGLRATKMYVDTVSNPIGAVGFISSQAQYNGAQISSGSSQVGLVPIANSSLDVSATNAAQTIDSNLSGSQLNPSSGVFICFASGGTSQSGLVQIGGSGGRQLSVTLKIMGGTTC